MRNQVDSTLAKKESRRSREVTPDTEPDSCSQVADHTRLSLSSSMSLVSFCNNRFECQMMPGTVGFEPTCTALLGGEVDCWASSSQSPSEELGITKSSVEGNAAVVGMRAAQDLNSRPLAHFVPSEHRRPVLWTDRDLSILS